MKECIDVKKSHQGMYVFQSNMSLYGMSIIQTLQTGTCPSKKSVFSFRHFLVGHSEIRNSGLNKRRINESENSDKLSA